MIARRLACLGKCTFEIAKQEITVIQNRFDVVKGKGGLVFLERAIGAKANAQWVVTERNIANGTEGYT